MSKILKIAFRFFLYLPVFYGLQVHAQSLRTMQRRAEENFREGAYYSAAKWYAAILYDSPLVNKPVSLLYPFQSAANTHTGKIRSERRNELLYRLAESYRLYAHYAEALPQYEKYIASKDTRYPLAGLWYAECLLAADQPEKSNAMFTAFLQKYKTQDSFLTRARMGIANTNFAINQKKMPVRAVVSKLPLLASADGSNFALTKDIDSSHFLFSSSRHETDPENGKQFRVQLYMADTRTAGVEKLTGFDKGLQMGTPVLTSDGLTLYFTGWKEKKKGEPAYYRIYSVHRNSMAEPWGTPVLLPETVNLPGYHSRQPFITADQHYLLFASDRPGGFGRSDIWMVELYDGKPVGDVLNAGAAVNTPGDEASPFYDETAHALYFSSNGRVGMGGMDIYRVNGELSGLQWKEPTMNLGYPFNSVKDDLYFIKKGNSDTAYLSSDRASGCCVEIFKAVALHYQDTPAKQPVVTDALQREKVLKPVEDETAARKKLMDSISAVTLNRLHINYRFASARIRQADHAILEQVITMLRQDTSLNILVASFTDCIGSPKANEILSRRRSASVRQYLLARGIASARINLDFFGKKHPVLACREDSSYHTDQQMANRRSDLILTKEEHPVWVPTGRELDIDPPLPYTLIANQNTGKQQPVTNTVVAATDMRAGDRSGEITTNTLSGTKEKTNSTGNSAYNKLKKKETVTAADTVAYATAKNSLRTENKNATDRLDSGKEPKQKKGMVKPAGQATVAKPVIRTMPRDSQRDIGYADSLKQLKIAALIDPMPRLKIPALIDQMTSRTPKKSFEVYTSSDSVKVELYDNGVFDKDSVSVIFNKALVAYKEELHTNKPVTFYVKLSSDIKRNEMIFFAENLGLTPPNSALMIITDGENKRTEINVSSDLEHNAVIYFIKVKK